MTPTTQNSSRGDHQAAGVIALLSGLWLFVSPWVFGIARDGSAFNAWIVGAVIAVVSMFQLAYRELNWISWINCLLSIWIFAAPWIFGYTAIHDRMISSLCVGVVVFVVSIWTAMSPPHPSHPVATMR